MVLQVKEKGNQKMRVHDIYILISVIPLGDMWSRKPFLRRYTYLYHLRWDGYTYFYHMWSDGYLTLEFRIDEELPLQEY
jgi:hypothetical protein